MGKETLARGGEEQEGPEEKHVQKQQHPHWQWGDELQQEQQQEQQKQQKRQIARESAPRSTHCQVGSRLMLDGVGARGRVALHLLDPTEQVYWLSFPPRPDKICFSIVLLFIEGR